ncbi:DUF484 family protein [Lysobacter sp. HDW10]|uniref:DUF484 family protein n=1 Tax=Lysobacter sp. HDW10 TaxID=2714936 RepID=UPI00140AAE82|nr:DUF484 family protein [Lysobacter sp. HDW10]QIK81032.1 DUF484 family protein [Lysobacter sp. HDW10]
MSDNEERLGAHEVAVWLRRHPTFLQQFPDLALTLVVPRDDGPTASLASYQLDVLRDKNRELNRRLHELALNAQENERLAVRTHQLTLALMKQTTAADTLKVMAAILAEDFHGDRIRILTVDSIAGIESASWYGALPADSLEQGPFKDCMREGDPLSGRLNADKHAALYGAYADEVHSSILIPVYGRALVAVGSKDPNRFYPGMGTLFVRMMGEALGTALARFD